MSSTLHNSGVTLAPDETEQPGTPPWMAPTCFPVPPAPETHGYQKNNKNQSCSQDELIEEIRSDTGRRISLIWTPQSTRLAPPEEAPWAFDAVHARERGHWGNVLALAILQTVLWSPLVVLSMGDGSRLAQILVFNLVVLGLIPIVESSWRLYHLRSYTSETMAEVVPEARYRAWLGGSNAYWTWGCVVCISIVYVGQLVADLRYSPTTAGLSIDAAGIVKPAIYAGQWWRLLTGTLLHASPMHFLFNIAALFALGKVLEVTFHRVYVPLVFLVAGLGGSLTSLILLPSTTSVGASGGIMGLLGSLLVFGYRQRQGLPRDFYRRLLISVVYIAIAGLLAYRVIDNPAHLGGFVAGIGFAVAFARNRQFGIPHRVTPSVYCAGAFAGVVLFGTTVLCLCVILDRCGIHT